jgi:hypothetical protein
MPAGLSMDIMGMLLEYQNLDLCRVFCWRIFLLERTLVVFLLLSQLVTRSLLISKGT